MPLAVRPVAGSTATPRATALRIAASVRGVISFLSLKTVPSRSNATRRISCIFFTPYTGLLYRKIAMIASRTTLC